MWCWKSTRACLKSFLNNFWYLNFFVNWSFQICFWHPAKNRKHWMKLFLDRYTIILYEMRPLHACYCCLLYLPIHFHLHIRKNQDNHCIAHQMFESWAKGSECSGVSTEVMAMLGACVPGWWEYTWNKPLSGDEMLHCYRSTWRAELAMWAIFLTGMDSNICCKYGF
jgi:hypothetical protein